VIRARAAGREVKLVWDAHEHLPGVKRAADDPRWGAAMHAHEREYAHLADAVITVSDTLADLLRRDHGLTETPTVALNAPERLTDDEAGPAAPSLREACDLEPDVPLMVYSGVPAPQRGLDVMVEALPRLPDVHCAFVVGGTNPLYLAELIDRAAALGVADRLHVLPYVPARQVVRFLSSADIGVIPIHHWPNHQIALITKFFEYSHARLPIVVSDVKAMSEAVRTTGQGEVFTAEDTADFVRAASAVLADPQRYRRAYEGPADLDAWTWERQAEILDGVYRRVLRG
jgi:glycogen synthase